MRALAIAALAMASGCTHHGADTASTRGARTEVFSLKRACMELGARKEEVDRKALEALPGQVPWPAEYCYSDRRNTCLYSGGHLSEAVQSFRVVDLLTNETLAAYAKIKDGASSQLSSEEFERKRKELMAECAD